MLKWDSVAEKKSQ